MRPFLLLALTALPALSESVLYATATFSQTYFVGAQLAPSGLFRHDGPGKWTHLGYNLPIISTLAPERDSLLLAAGNGLIRAAAGGQKWTILTGSDVTELRDVAVANNAIYFACTRGIRRSTDSGQTWTDITGDRRRKYTESVRIASDGTLIAGTENGIWSSRDSGKAWQLAGAAGFQILHIEASPNQTCEFLAATQGGGIFASHDCGRSFENTGRDFAVGQNVYDISFDPHQRSRVAAAGFGPGIAISEDGGKSWTRRNAGLPSHDATSVVFDPDHQGRLYAALHEDALYVSDDAGLTWRKEGMEHSHIGYLRFVPEVRK